MFIATATLAFGLFLCAFFLAPPLFRQAALFVSMLPTYAQHVQGIITSMFADYLPESATDFDPVGQMARLVQSRGGELLRGLLVSAQSLFSLLSLLLITPVVTVYLLLDWDRIIARINRLLPASNAPVIRRLARETDLTLSSFVRGQLSVCAILAVFYAVSLSVAGLNYALVIGLVTGAVTFIPFVGTLLGGGMALGVALFQFWGDWAQIAVIAAIFVAGQVLEGNFLTPRLVGRSVGLHPVWVLLGLSFFGAMFGFIGMLISVPLAAVVGVLARYAVERYEASGIPEPLPQPLPEHLD